MKRNISGDMNGCWSSRRLKSKNKALMLIRVQRKKCLCWNLVNPEMERWLEDLGTSRGCLEPSANFSGTSEMKEVLKVYD